MTSGQQLGDMCHCVTVYPLVPATVTICHGIDQNPSKNSNGGQVQMIQLLKLPISVQINVICIIVAKLE